MADWDVIVVGAGSAGAPMAARLSERSGRRILLLEAGPNHDSAHTPASIRGKAIALAAREPGRIWPGLMAARSPGRAPALYLRGRGVGGSSAVNAQVAIRGLPDDYDRWAAAGCTGWDWAGVRGAFDKVADNIPAERTAASEWSRFDQALQIAAVARGHPLCDSYETPGVLGLAPAGLTRRDGQRVSTNDAYLEPARSRPNLEIRGDILVDRVIVERGRAVGLRTLDGEIRAGHVVVSAGAIHSPAILLRSGLGERRPGVGQNLGEHPSVGASINLRPEAVDEQARCPSSGCLLRWSSELPGCGEADLQILPISNADPAALGRVLVLAALMAPFSRGEVSLASDDPQVDPIVDFNLMSDPRDAARMRLVAQELCSLLTSPAMAAVTESAFLDERGTRPTDIADPIALDAWLKTAVTDYVHAVGTCRMGAPDDPMAVVDPHCRFIGLEGLSVVDASVAPSVPRANTHLTAVMIAEKAATLFG